MLFFSDYFHLDDLSIVESGVLKFIAIIVLLCNFPFRLVSISFMYLHAFQVVLVVKKKPTCSARDTGDASSIPWRRKWQPTPVFLLGKSMDRGV